MDVTLLGSGDATSMPAPLCDCRYCVASERRRHPSVLVETDDATLLLDAGPDCQEQLAETDTRSVDAVLLTHAHGDHTAGLPQLYQAAKWNATHLDGLEGDEFEPTPDGFDPGYPIYCTETARDHLADDWPYLTERLDIRTIEHDSQIAIGGTRVVPVPVEHHRPTFDTVGYLVRSDAGSVLYAPDMRSFVENPPRGVDLLVCEGAAVLGQPVHGPRDELVDAIESIDAERVVLVNVNEHLQRAHTEELERRAAEAGYELGVDFETYPVR